MRRGKRLLNRMTVLAEELVTDPLVCTLLHFCQSQFGNQHILEILSSNDSKGKGRPSRGKKKILSPQHLSGGTVGHHLSGSGGSPVAARSRGLSPTTIGNRKENYISPLKSITRENLDECLELLKRFFKYFGLAFLKGKFYRSRSCGTLVMNSKQTFRNLETEQRKPLV